MSKLPTDHANPSFAALSKEQLLDLPFEDLGLSSIKLKRLQSFRISTLRELKEYLKSRKKEHTFCSGRYLTRTMMKELSGLLKDHNIAWTLEDLIDPNK